MYLNMMLGIGGHIALGRAEMAIPIALPDRMLRDLPRPREPVHLVEISFHHVHDALHAHPELHPLDTMVPSTPHIHLRVLDIRAQMSLLLRGRAARVLSSGEDELLLRAVDSMHVPRIGGPTTCHGHNHT